MEHLSNMGKSKAILFRDPLVEQVVDELVERSDIGFAKYKVTLEEERTTGAKDLGIYLQDTKEELMDAILYIQSTQNSLKDLKKKMRGSGSFT